MRPGLWIVILTGPLLLVGCDEDNPFSKKYEVKEINHQTYLIDQKSGQLFVQEGNRLIELRRYDDSDLQRLQTSKNWFALPIKGLSFDTNTKFQDGALQYKFFVEGQSKPKPPEEPKSDGQKKDGNEKGESAAPADATKAPLVDDNWRDYWSRDGNKLVLNFVDADAFKVTNHVFLLSGIYSEPSTQIVDDDGKVIGFEYEGAIPITLEQYQRITGINITYVLEKQKK
jgi:hypothetical protein